MFSYSNLFKNSGLKLLFDYPVFNKYLHVCNRISCLLRKSFVQEIKKHNLCTSSKVTHALLREHDKNDYNATRYFSSKFVNNLKENNEEKAKCENSKTEETSSKGETLPDSDGECTDFYKVDEEAITNGDPDLLKRLKLCMLEIETFRQEGYDIPTSLKTQNWKELVGFHSRNSKLNYLRYLFVNECRRRNDKIRKEKKRLQREEDLKKLIESSNPDHIRYGMGGNTIFLRIHPTTMNVLANNRLVTAMKFGQDLIIDCSYDSYMTKKEMNYCAKQLMYCFSHNRNNDDPFNIHFTGVNHEGYLMKRLHTIIPTMYDWDFPMNLTEKSYLELFPKEKLVYLTPHCRNDLVKFNHDDIYIIGGIVDKTNCEPLSLAKAKSEGLRMARFPLDRYLSWSLGTKSLTLDQCTNILLDLKKTNNWEQALQHVPRRKIVESVSKLNEDDEERRDKSMQFGQTYVTSHEWGINRKPNTVRKRLINRSFDLRTIVEENKRRSKGDR